MAKRVVSELDTHVKGIDFLVPIEGYEKRPLVPFDLFNNNIDR